jgi:hypothetical protein
LSPLVLWVWIQPSGGHRRHVAAPDAAGSEKVRIESGIIVDVFGGAERIPAGAPSGLTDDWLNIRVKELKREQ